MTSRPVAFFLGFCLLLVGLLDARAADWPTYRADARRSGYSADSLPSELSLRWVHRAAPPRPAWPSSSRITFDFVDHPIIAGGAVVFGSSREDKVVALEAASGRPRWTFLAGGPVRFAPCAWHDRVFAACDDGFLYALRLADGALLWKFRGGPNGRMCLGNERMISRWPARGGPVVAGDVVYFAAGIWPSNGVYLHALDAATGRVVWTNDHTGRLEMPQPHGGANALSGVAPQGYLLATQERLFVPTGRAVPAAFRRHGGALEYYRLQQNGSMGGSRALVADRFVVNGGCFLQRDSGNLAARAGRGVFSTLPDGMLRWTGKTLTAYRWAELEKPDRKGKPVRYRGLEKRCEVALDDASTDRARDEKVLAAIPSLKPLYQAEVRFKEADEAVAKMTGLERTLSQARPDVRALGDDVGPFLATTYERRCEVIAAAGEAVCGGPNRVRVVDLDGKKVRFSHEVEGTALGLAAAGGLLVVSTTEGVVYGFGPAADDSPTPPGGDAQPPGGDAQPPRVSGSEQADFASLAKQILAASGVSQGFCLDLGCGTGGLALELARQSDLYVVGIEADSAKVARARRLLDAAGVHGRRVSVIQGDPDQPPCPRHFANLVVSSSQLIGGPKGNPEAIERMLRPYGGVACLGKPGDLQVNRRGPLEGAGRWTHQNCDSANTLCSTDRIGGPLEAAWYRDGVLEIPDRHAQGPCPLFNRGYLVVEGVNGVCALDAYNGRTLWTYAVDGVLADWDGVHHDVGVGDTGSNFCLGDAAVFLRTGDRCLKIDLATGRKLHEFKTPVDGSASNRAWGYVASAGGILYGSVLNDEHKVSPRYADIRLRTESVLFFALDAQSGALKWQYRPRHSIRNNAIAIAGGRVYLIDRVLALQDRILHPRVGGKQGPPLKPGQHPGGTLLALDGGTGKLLWSNDDDIFGTQIAVSEKHGVLLMYYQAVKHSFFKLPSEIGGRMAAFDTAGGKRLWDAKMDYKTRPIIHDDVIYAEGGAWKLTTGEPVPWTFQRSYGCGQIAAGANLMLFRSATLGYLDLGRKVGTENFGGIRTSCWFNAIPAGGLVLVPDGSSKCACSYQMQAWLALERAE